MKRSRNISKLSRKELELYPTEVLDREAFGFTSGQTLVMDLDEIHIKYGFDLENAESDITTLVLARAILNRTQPVEVALRRGRFELEDGHHRYVASRMLGKKTVEAVVEIHDNPITKILARASR
jgi:hypothetical protein